MLGPLSDVVSILETYRYWIIFPVVIIEGPIITIISGFLVYLGVLNPYFTYALLIVGDLIGDTLYYLIGKYWRKSSWIKKIGKFVGYNEKSEKFLEDHFKKHYFKTLLVAKFSHGIGGTIQASAGIAGVNYFKFLWINFIGVIPKTFVLFVLGFYLGGSYLKINSFLNSLAVVFVSILVFVVLYFASKKLVKTHFKKED